MSDNDNGNGNGNGNGKNGRLNFGQMLLAVIGSLMVAGITGLIVLTINLSSRLASLETQVISYNTRITKLENDVYTTRFADRLGIPRTAGVSIPPSAQ